MLQFCRFFGRLYGVHLPGGGLAVARYGNRQGSPPSRRRLRRLRRLRRPAGGGYALMEVI